MQPFSRRCTTPVKRLNSSALRSSRVWSTTSHLDPLQRGIRSRIRLVGGQPMSRIENKLRALGLTLPPPTRPPPGVILPFQFVHVVGRRALISGHGPQNPDGSFALPLGKLGRELTVEQGYAAARMTALSILGSL